MWMCPKGHEMRSRNRSKRNFYCDTCGKPYKVRWIDGIPVCDLQPIKVDEEQIEAMKKQLGESLKDAKGGKGRKVH